MDIEKIRQRCLPLPYATEDIQWVNDLLFRVGGKIFAAVDLGPSSNGSLSFKCSPEKFAELIECDGISPARYVARYHWVTVSTPDALSETEINALIKESYNMALARLSKKVRAQLGEKGVRK